MGMLIVYVPGLDVFNVHSILLNVYQDELNLANQLDPSDASFVDILHTSDGKAGLKGDYGKIDFYPDGGKIQRSCLQGNEFANWWERATGKYNHWGEVKQTILFLRIKFFSV